MVGNLDTPHPGDSFLGCRVAAAHIPPVSFEDVVYDLHDQQGGLTGAPLRKRSSRFEGDKRWAGVLAVAAHLFVEVS
jgi:hypothetical protein